MPESSVKFQKEVEQLYGERLVELFVWAKDSNQLEIAECLFFVLGLGSYGKKKATYWNIIYELTIEESTQTLNEWQETNEVKQLIQFSQAYKNSSIAERYPPISLSGDTASAAKRIDGYSAGAALLAMVTNPLTHDRELYKERRMLRLWVIVHAVMRMMRYEYHGDKKVDRLARFLVMGPDAVRSWELVDTILTRAMGMSTNPSFKAFNYALVTQAESLLSEKSHKKNEKNFLQDMIATGNYECHPDSKLIQQNSVSFIKFSQKKTSLTKSVLTLEIDPDFPEANIEFNYLPVEGFNADLGVDSVESDDAYIEDQEDLLYLGVDPEQNDAEQLLPTRSIYLHTAEAAQHLPWSWKQVLPSEKIRFSEWLNQTLKSTNLSDALGACFCLLAMQTGRSLVGVCRFEVTGTIGDEWSVNEKFTLLNKKSTRDSKSWKPDEITNLLVAEHSNILAISIPSELGTILERASRNTDSSPDSLHSMWLNNVPNTKPEVWLNQALPEDLSRVTSGKLESYLGQQVFENTSDHNLARVVSAHPNSGLPSSTGYSAWSIKDIEKGIEQPLLVEPTVSSKTHLLGSLLSPLETLLCQHIEQANNKLNEKGINLIEYHNLISQYTVYALFAATGARYLKDPFESITHFNFEQNFVFINDKSDGGIHQGRIVPLPLKTVHILQQYISHLEKLAGRLADSHIELTDNIREAVREGSELIPLFFLLDQDLNWHNLSQAEALGEPLFEWGLPKNLFRHRYSQQLQQANIPVEVLDGLMGHAERGSITYGDTSPRCWLDDVSAYSPNINALFDVLPFVAITPSTESLLFSVPSLDKKPTLKSRLFGYKERQKSRLESRRRGIQEARNDIRYFLRGRKLEDISEEEVQQLINVMLLRGKQIGHPFAAMRLEILRRKIHRQAPEHKKVLRSRLVPGNPISNTLSETVAQNYQTFEGLKVWRTNITGCRSQYSKSLAVLIGTVILAIDKRIAYPRLLNDVLEGKNFRLVQDKRQIFIEYSEELNVDNPYAPVQRHETNQQTASLISYGLARKKHAIQPDNNEVITLKKILRLEAEANNADIVQALAHCIEQANHVALPGMVGAMLAGRVLATSLPIEDHLRAKYGKALIWKAPKPPEELSQFDNIQSVLTGRLEVKDTLELKASAAQFRREVLAVLSGYKPSQSKATAREVNTICSSYEGKVSNSLLLVGFWIGHIVKRGRRNRKSKPLAISTIKTYWSVLFTTFEQLAYQANLIEMDSDEITSLYRDMIDYKTIKADSLEYFGNRLMDFQAWAKDFGVLDPDWSELDFKDEGRMVRPGLLTEQDYQTSLKYIQSAYSDADTQLLMSFLLLLTYRFGLRSREASGLLAKDWCKNELFTWVLIRNNKYRKLKTESSQRPVPLLFNLSDREELVIERMLVRYSSLSGDNKKNPLFCELDNGKIVSHSLIPAMPSAIISVIRTVTGSSNLVLHHARHSFHNRTAAALLEIESPMTLVLNKDIDRAALQEIVLGTNHNVSRRSPMALARLMGHSAPATGMRSYNHLLTEWADQLTPVASQRIEVSGAINTKDFKKYKAPKLKKIRIEYQPASMENIFKVLRLVAIGWSYEKAGHQLGLSPAVVQSLEKTFNQANDKMRFNNKNDKSKVMGAELPHALLRYITSDAWQRILSIVAAIPDETLKNLPALPSLEELPNLVSRHRQVFIETEEHANLVKLVLELFSIDKNHYSVCAKNDDPNMKAFLQDQGFEVTPVKHASYKATPIVPDVFEVYENGALTGTRTNYGVLNLFRNEGSLRNGGDLAVVFLGIGSALRTKIL